MQDLDRTLKEYGVAAKDEIVLVTMPLQHLLPTEECFDPDGKPNLPNIYKHFQWEGLLRRADALRIVEEAQQLLSKEPNILYVEEPVNGVCSLSRRLFRRQSVAQSVVTVCGDIHGQFYDLEKIFEHGGDSFSGQCNWIFLGVSQ